MQFSEIQKKALEIKILYNNLNVKRGEKLRDISAYMHGFVWDVWSLSKLIQSKSGYRTINNLDEKLEAEISDCLRAIIVIADELWINIENSFIKNMKTLENRVKETNWEYKEHL